MAQVAAIMAIGLLFYNTADLHLVKVLLYEIGRSPSADNDMPFCQESHALTSGFALGMIMIGVSWHFIVILTHQLPVLP